MTRRIGYVAMLVGVAALVASRFVAPFLPDGTLAGETDFLFAVAAILVCSAVAQTDD